jgi:hypothetical protein
MSIPRNCTLRTRIVHLFHGHIVYAAMSTSCSRHTQDPPGFGKGLPCHPNLSHGGHDGQRLFASGPRDIVRTEGPKGRYPPRSSAPEQRKAMPVTFSPRTHSSGTLCSLLDQTGGHMVSTRFINGDPGKATASFVSGQAAPI